MEKEHHPDHFKRLIFELEINSEEETIIVTYPGGNQYQYELPEGICTRIEKNYEDIKRMGPASGNTQLGPLIKYIKENSTGYTQL